MELLNRGTAEITEHTCLPMPVCLVLLHDGGPACYLPAIGFASGEAGGSLCSGNSGQVR